MTNKPIHLHMRQEKNNSNYLILFVAILLLLLSLLAKGQAPEKFDFKDETPFQNNIELTLNAARK